MLNILEVLSKYLLMHKGISHEYKVGKSWAGFKGYLMIQTFIYYIIYLQIKWPQLLHYFFLYIPTL